MKRVKLKPQVFQLDGPLLLFFGNLYIYSK